MLENTEGSGTSKAQNLVFPIGFTMCGSEKDRGRGILVTVMNHQKVKSHA